MIINRNPLGLEPAWFRRLILTIPRMSGFLMLLCLAAGSARVRAAEMNQPIPNEIRAGPIWNEGDAQKKCPNVCAQVRQPWNGLWRTTVWGQMSVCSCGGAAPAAMPSGAGTACTAPATEDCGGCAVTCPPGKQASCKQGERFSADTPGCWNKARCACD
jgi:Mannan-binding protein